VNALDILNLAKSASHRRLVGNHHRQITGFIDLGRSGAADMYVDLALSVRSLRHNLDGTYSSVSYPSVDPRRLYSLLGISPDEDLMRYYLLLDELF